MGHFALFTKLPPTVAHPVAFLTTVTATIVAVSSIVGCTNTSTNDTSTATGATHSTVTFTESPTCTAPQGGTDTWSTLLTDASATSEGGWLASDGFLSVELPNNATLFLNGDTLYGTRNGDTGTNITATRNSGIIYTPYGTEDGRCVVSLPTPHRSGILNTSTNADMFPEYFMWPGATIPFPEGEQSTWAFAHTMYAPPAQLGEQTLAFQQTGTVLVPLTHTTTHPTDTTGVLEVGDAAPLPLSVSPEGQESVNWGQSVAQDATFTYAYGTSVTAAHRKLHIARIPQSELGNITNPAMWEVLTPTGWVSATTAVPVHNLAELPTPADPGAGFSVTYSEESHQWTLVTKPHDFLGDTILIATADAPEGPFTEKTSITLPTNNEAWTYNAHSHPSLPAPEGHMWISVDKNVPPTGGTTTAAQQLSSYQPMWYLIEV